MSGSSGARYRLFAGGSIRPLDPALPERVEALLVEGSRIVAVGSREQTRARAQHGGIEEIDLGGRCLMPGFIDAHFHLVWLGESRLELDLGPARSRAQAVELVREAVRSRRDRGHTGEWLMGRRWNQESWADRLPPESGCLDAVTGDRPVYLVRVDGHAAWVNTAARERAGVTEDTPDPPGGQLVRDAQGRLTGELLDHAMGLVKAVIPPPPASRARDAVLEAQRTCFANGITSVHDMFVDEEAWGALESLDSDGKLLLEVRGYAGVETTIERVLAAPRGDLEAGARRFGMLGLKLFADGALGSHGAALLEPYTDRPCDHGLELLAEDQIAGITQRALAGGWQVATHVIGDRAVRSALAAYRRALEATPGVPHRLRLEHLQTLPPGDGGIPAMRELGIVASVQPVHANSDCRMARARLGPERLRRSYLLRRLKDAGLAMAGGSDAPVEDPSPLAGLAAVLSRNPPGETGLDPEERLELADALALFTRHAAWAGYQEARKGRLAPGLDADLVILERDPAGRTAAELVRLAVCETWVAGERVFAAGGG